VHDSESPNGFLCVTTTFTFDIWAIILVNRSFDQTSETRVTLADFPATRPPYTTLTLLQLRRNETFRSHTDNVLKKGTVPVAGGNTIDLVLAPLSIKAILLSDDLSDTPPSTTSRIELPMADNK
jgi:hypothetical protein